MCVCEFVTLSMLVVVFVCMCEGERAFLYVCVRA